MVSARGHLVAPSVEASPPVSEEGKVWWEFREDNLILIFPLDEGEQNETLPSTTNTLVLVDDNNNFPTISNRK